MVGWGWGVLLAGSFLALDCLHTGEAVGPGTALTDDKMALIVMSYAYPLVPEKKSS